MNLDPEVLRREIKEYIIEELNLEDITPDDIENDAPLFVEGLGLDSIDALELVVIMERYYGVKIPNEEVGRKVLQSINTMVDYIIEEKGQ
ncbi:MAG: acyl carrier protein [Bacteroidetes bacterium]|nr:MAG: acyl carrier protein [Bacteroidota bacterium]TNE99002.1 MAG: acyl carrier protein [Bacteroidota bacterium]